MRRREAFVFLLLSHAVVLSAAEGVFNVKEYGARGRKADDARGAIQKAIDACGAAGDPSPDVDVFVAAGDVAEQTWYHNCPLEADSIPVTDGASVTTRIATRAIQLESVRRPRRKDMARF